MGSTSTAELASTAGAAVTLSLLLTPLVRRWLLRREVLDRPNHRSSHVLPTPRGGGLAVAVGASVALGVSGASGIEREALLASAGLFGLLGLAEDLHNLAPLTRLGIQAVLALGSLVLVLHGLSGPVAWRVGFGLGVMLWLVGFVNVFNFMDGINGLATVQAMVAGGVWAYLGIARHHPSLALAGLAVAAAALGFLPFNFPGARIFLGDVGSYFLGAWLAVTAVIALRAGIAPEAALGPLAVFVADAAWTLARRLRNHEVWYEAHRGHVYQRLIDLGWSHARATASIGALMVGISLLGLVSLQGHFVPRALADGAGALTLGFYLASPRLLASSPQAIGGA